MVSGITGSMGPIGSGGPSPVDQAASAVNTQVQQFLQQLTNASNQDYYVGMDGQPISSGMIQDFARSFDQAVGNLYASLQNLQNAYGANTPQGKQVQVLIDRLSDTQEGIDENFSELDTACGMSNIHPFWMDKALGIPVTHQQQYFPDPTPNLQDVHPSLVGDGSSTAQILSFVQNILSGNS